MNALFEFINAVNGIILGPWTLYILLGAGIIFTIWTRFCQFRVMTHGVAVTRGIYDNPDDPGAINHFQALSAALSATIGLGNIGGVAVAISLGGPGALFWMWVIAFLGMALKTVEITLTMLYRNTDDPDDPHGGAMWVIEKVLGSRGGWKKVLARAIGIVFCITLLVMTMAGGNMFQTWNVSDLTFSYFGIPRIVTGIVLAMLVGMVIVGGIKRIGQVAGRLVPIMCILYLLAALAVLAVNVERIPGILAEIFRCAFQGTEACGAFVGGTLGVVFGQGMKRALFSNEAGLGSAPIAHAAAKTGEPAREGIVGGMGPFVDTICVCTLTALVIMSTDTWNRPPDGPLGGEIDLVCTAGAATGEAAWTIDGPASPDALPSPGAEEPWRPGEQVFVMARIPDGAGIPAAGHRMRVYGEITPAEGDTGRMTVDWYKLQPAPPAPGTAAASLRVDLEEQGAYRDYAGATLTGHAFDRAFPGLGKWLVTLAAWLFAVSTMISWSYYGEQGSIYLFGARSVFPYKLAFLVLAVVGAFLVRTDAELGALADFGTGGMFLANMIIVLTCGFLAIRALRDYFGRLKRGEMHPHAAPRMHDVVDGSDVDRDRKE